MKMDKIAVGVKEGGPKTPGMEELLKGRESALNLAALAEEELNNAVTVVSAAGPTLPQPSPRAEHLQSLILKLNEIAHQPDGARPINLDLDEQKELIPLMGKYRRGTEAVHAGEKFMSDEDIETIVRVMALHPGQSEMAGILALDDSKAKDRVARALKIYAFKNPEDYASIVNNLSTARNFVKSDWRVVSAVFDVVEKYGIDRPTVMQALDRDDWLDQLTAAAAGRMQRKWSTISGIQELGFRNSLARLAGSVEKYRNYAPERARFTGEIDSALQKVFMEEGVAGTLLTQEALQPNAPPESKRAFDVMQSTRTEVREFMNNNNAFETSLMNDLQHDPRWVGRNHPAVSQELAKDWLDNTFKNRLHNSTQGGEVGSFWSRLWEVLTSLFGTAYHGGDVNRVSSKIRSM